MDVKKDLEFNDEKLLTVQEICKRKGLKSSLMYWWIRNRSFDIIKVGKKVLIPETAFMSFLKSYEIKKYESQSK